MTKDKLTLFLIHIDDDIRIGDPLTTAATIEEATTVEPGKHRCIS